MMFEPHLPQPPAQTAAVWPQRHPRLFALADREVLTVQAAPHARWLHVQQGRLWATATLRPAQSQPLSQAPAASDDHWLLAGDALWLAPHQTWVLEAAPRAVWVLAQADNTAPINTPAARWRARLQIALNDWIAAARRGMRRREQRCVPITSG